jgi:FkbM family methyltransferase
MISFFWKIGIKNSISFIYCKLINGLFYRISPMVKKQFDFLNQIKGNNYLIKYSFGIFQIKFTFNKKPLNLFLRGSSSDTSVFRQIFINKEYGFITKILPSVSDYKIIIVDIGANIGLVTAFFKCLYENPVIYCLEPEPENFQQLKKNVNLNKFQNVSCYNYGIWDSETQLNFSFNFRDHQSWAVQLYRDSNKEKNIIKVKTLNNVLSSINVKVIDILKIDIEGAEAKIFNDEENYDYLRRIKIILIEIHDEYDCRARINNILERNNFLLSVEGEFTIGIKNAFLNKNNKSL